MAATTEQLPFLRACPPFPRACCVTRCESAVSLPRKRKNYFNRNKQSEVQAKIVLCFEATRQGLQRNRGAVRAKSPSGRPARKTIKKKIYKILCPALMNDLIN